MAQVVATNYSSLTAQNQLNKTNAGLTQSLARLSSGLRINSAKDDAAGLAISERFTAQVRGFNQGSRNAADAISMAQTAEGALSEMTSNVQRIRELAIQSSNGTYSAGDRSMLNKEVQQLNAELTRIAANTKFNELNIFNPTGLSTTIFQVGANNGANDRISINIYKFSSDAELTAVTGATVNTAADASAMVGNVDILLNRINDQRANLGAIQNRFESVIRSADTASANLADSRSRIRDTDFASETANLTKMQILQQAGISVLSQANSMPQSALSLLG
ncbi:MAG: flagellin FliC [Gammaproteobacteria bacterium]|nr:flagellin FliC [Gammaproteobacteria bacterium]